jgi:hypothetical protein
MGSIMKVFVTGSETDKSIVFEAMTKLYTKYCFDEVITEGRAGLDELIHQWCSLARLDVQAIPNNGDVENYHQCKLIKNQRPNMILAFPGWNENIKRYAQKYESVIEEISVAK